MAVLECSCGMVMSVSVAKPRNTCIRCGGVEFRELDRFKPVVNATDHASQVIITTGGNVLPMQPRATAGNAVRPAVAECSL
jgi:hypothetical protein